MFPKAEFLNSIVRNPTFSENLAYRQITIFSTFQALDEVIAVGAANQASLLTDDKMDLNQNPDGSITVQATQYDITFEASTEKADEPQILIPKNCPIPIRKSHLIPATSEEISVKLFLRNGEKSTDLAEVSELKILGF